MSAARVYSAIVRGRAGAGIASSGLCRSVAEAVAWLDDWLATTDGAWRAVRAEVISAPLDRPEHAGVDAVYGVEDGTWVEVAYLPARRRAVDGQSVRARRDSIRGGIL